MKAKQFFKVMLVGLAVTFATGAFAASNVQKGRFQILSPAQVNGTQLPAGEYLARWEGTGASVNVEIVRDGKVVATVPAKVTDLGHKADQDASEVNEVDGHRALSALRFAGKKVQLDLGGSAAEANGMK